MTHPSLRTLFVVSIAALGAAGCTSEITSQADALVVACVDARAEAGPGAWFCGDAIEVECADGLGSPAVLYTDSETFPEGVACADVELAPDDPGPYPVGDHTVIVSAGDGTEVCEATLRVVDTLPPVATPRSPVELWPPNHRLEDISVHDCVMIDDRCDRDVELYFTHITSDEPLNATGDGNTDADIVVRDCQTVALRAERRGPEDGRVYSLGWRAVDAAGLSVEGTCKVVVPHDQSGRPAVEGAPLVTVDAC